MTAFHDYEPLPLIPHDFAVPAQDAWRVVRELHAQHRISTVEAMAIFDGLSASTADVQFTPPASLPLRRDV